MNKRKKALILLLCLLLCAMLTGCSEFQTQMAKTTSKMAKLENFRMGTDISLKLKSSIGEQELNGSATLTGVIDFETDPFLVKTDLVLHALGADWPVQYYIEKDYDTFLFVPYGDSDIRQSTLTQKTTKKARTTQALKLLIRCGDYFEDAVADEIDGESVVRYDGILPDEYVDEALRLMNILEEEKAEAGESAAAGSDSTQAAASEATATSAAAGKTGAAVDTQPLTVSGLACSLWVNSEGMIVQMEVDLRPFFQNLLDDFLENLQENYELDGLNLQLKLKSMEGVFRFSDFDSLEKMELPE